MKKTKIFLAATAITAAMSMPVMAGSWQEDANGWWYQNDDGTYPTSKWEQIDGNWYYFHPDGYMAYNTWIDGYYLNNDGVMVPNGTTEDGTQRHSVSNISYTGDSVTHDLYIQDWNYDSYGTTLHILEITNNSQYTLELNINETAKDSSGTVIGASSTSENDLPAGCTVFLVNYFSNVSNVNGYDTSIQAIPVRYYDPVIQNVALEVNDLGDKVIVKATNNGGVPVEFLEATAVFFKDNEVIYYGTEYLIDNSYELKPGASFTGQIDYYNFDDVDYDTVRVHVTGRHYN